MPTQVLKLWHFWVECHFMEAAIHRMAFSSNAQAQQFFKTVSRIFLGLLDQFMNDLVRVSRNEMAKILDPQNHLT
jgi:hypothetical protein